MSKGIKMGFIFGPSCRPFTYSRSSLDSDIPIISGDAETPLEQRLTDSPIITDDDKDNEDFGYEGCVENKGNLNSVDEYDMPDAKTGVDGSRCAAFRVMCAISA